MSSKGDDHPLASIAIEDLVAVRQYITKDYAMLDHALRALDMQKLGELDAYIRVATHGLFLLPSHRGPVFRGADLSRETLARYLPGLVIREHGFVSATANPAMRFPGNTTYVIESFNGRDVALIAEAPVEREVVFFTGTRFTLLDMDLDASGEATIYLREIPDARLVRGDADASAGDDDVLDALRRSRQLRDVMALPLRFPASRPDKYAHPIGIDDQGRFFPVPERSPSEIG